MIPVKKKHKLWVTVSAFRRDVCSAVRDVWHSGSQITPVALRLTTEEFTIWRPWKNPMLSLIATPTGLQLMRNAFCCSCSQIKPWPTPSDFVVTCSFCHGYAFKPKQASSFMAASFHPSGCTETENLRPTGLPRAAGETGPCPCCRWHNEHSSVEGAPAKLATGRGPWGWKTHPSGLHRLLNRPGQHRSIWPATVWVKLGFLPPSIQNNLL